jgi:hypothetical protein
MSAAVAAASAHYAPMSAAVTAAPPLVRIRSREDGLITTSASEGAACRQCMGAVDVPPP